MRYASVVAVFLCLAISGLSLVIHLGLLAAVDASVCLYNRDSSQLISGDNGNTVNNFLKVLRETNTFIVLGDTTKSVEGAVFKSSLNPPGCRKSIGQFLHRKGLYENNQTWILDCWEPTECTLIKERVQDLDYLRLVPKSWNPLNSWGRTQVNTVLLPIDHHDIISYTFIPYVSQCSAMFVTATLSGCSVFVATPDKSTCNIIVMHANWFCNRPGEGNDENHVQATYVLQQVQTANEQCKYQIQRRWSAVHNRQDIETHNYHYSDNIVYYNNINFVYGYNLGGGKKWQFCLKELNNSPQQEKCNEIV